MMASISLEELHLFHKIDREIFSRLVMKLARDPTESLLVMAAWLWLEEKGYPNIVVKMVEMPDATVNALANEAVLCLKCLDPSTPSAALSGGIPITARLMERDISLQLFRQNRFTATTGIKNFLNTICCQIFTDILQQVMAGTSQSTSNQPFDLPGSPHPIFGPITIVPTTTQCDFPTGELWGWQATDCASEDDRTIFLTFSRGFPVLEEEVKELFTKKYGDCVKSVHMGNAPSNNSQPLYAKMVLRSVENVDRILSGLHIAKFRINGKHIWARKYERRE